MIVAAFDLGIHNTAVAIEEFNDKEDSEDGVFSNGTILFIDKVDLAPGKKNAKMSDEVINNIMSYIETILDKLETCNVILIERQFKKAGKQNSCCIHLEHLIHTLLIYFFRGTKTKVIVYASKHKTKEFESKKMTKPQRKKWTVEQAGEIMMARQDYDTLKLLSSGKKDDYADVIMMIQSYKSKLIKNMIMA